MYIEHGVPLIKLHLKVLLPLRVKSLMLYLQVKMQREREREREREMQLSDNCLDSLHSNDTSESLI